MHYTVDAVDAVDSGCSGCSGCSRHSEIVVYGGGDNVFGVKRSNQWIQWKQYCILLKGYFNGLVTANMQKVLEVRVRCCACVWGNVLASGERDFQE